jgi:PIN domain nuclease of toxin-antitoxin system
MLNLDTHIVLFLLQNNLSQKETELILNVEKKLYISSIVLWELAMLKSKKGIDFDFQSPGWIDFINNVEPLPVSQEIAIQSCDLDFFSDPADEIIAATSIVHNIPLLTRDKNILKSKIVPFAGITS